MPTDPPPKKGKKRKLPQTDGAAKAKKKNKNGLHKQNGQKSNSKNTESLQSIFARVAQRRQKEITLLEPVLVRGFLMDVRELTGIELPSLVAAKSSASLVGININQAAHEVRKLLSSEYKLMSNENVSPDKRRKSWETVSEMFRLIDTLLGQDDEDDDNDSETTEQNVPSKTSASASASSSTTKTPAASAPLNGTKPGKKTNRSTRTRFIKSIGENSYKQQREGNSFCYDRAKWYQKQYSKQSTATEKGSPPNSGFSFLGVRNDHGDRIGQQQSCCKQK